MVYTILVIAQVLIALVLIGLILVQHGKGADAGAAFGSGASGTVFGAKGSANFMTHATAGLATVFFVISLTLAYLINGASTPTGSVTDQVQQQAPASSPLSDSNNNGVPGDETLSGARSKADGAGGQNGGQGAGQRSSDQNGAGGSSAGSATGQQSSGSAGDNAGGSDTGATVPE